MSNRLEEAAALLIKAVDYSKVVADLTHTVEAANKVASDYPKCFGALIELGMKDRDKFEAFIRQVQIDRLNNPDVKRQDYQRLLMRKRRARFSKMTAIAKLKKPSITPSELKAHLKQMNKVMVTERDAYIAEHKDDEDYNHSQAVDDFWKKLDTQLDEVLAKLRKAKL